MKIGYIGLGALGGELAKCFIKDHELHVWDLDPVAGARLGQLGAKVAATAADLGRSCDVILSCLPRSANVREVLFGPAGLAESLSAGKLVIDQTSGVPEETRELAQRLGNRGVAMLDAAVSASPHVVASGGATLMVGGADEVFDRALPVLQAITRTIIRCGARVGDGQAMKMVNNAINGGCRLGTLELVALGRKAGLPLQAMTEVLNRGAGRNQTTDKMLPAIVRGEASTNFALSLMLKDVSQAVQLGSSTGVPMPVTRTVRGIFQVGLNIKGPAARLEDMIGVIEAMAATRLPGAGEGAPQPKLLQLIDASLWALCDALSRECMAVGLAYGLDLHTMATVLKGTSGWSVALRELCAAIEGTGSYGGRSVRSAVENLRELAELGIRHDAPVLIANVAGSVFEQALADSQGDASVASLARQWRLLPSAAGIPTRATSRASLRQSTIQ